MKKIDNLIFDINKICDFVLANPNEKNSEVEIVENYCFNPKKNEMTPQTKTIREVKLNDYSNQNNMRYDMIRGFIETLNEVQDFKLMTLGQAITFNTLEAYELIKDIKDA
jgi:hypothetical protein